MGSVSCWAPYQCLATGFVAGHDLHAAPLAESWDGSSWSLTEPPVKPTGITFFTTVDCTAASNCVAVGFYYLHGTNIESRSLVEQWDSTAWSVTPSPSVPKSITTVNSVSCGDDDHCVAVGTTIGTGAYRAFAITGS